MIRTNRNRNIDAKIGKNGIIYNWRTRWISKSNFDIWI